MPPCDSDLDLFFHQIANSTTTVTAVAVSIVINNATITIAAMKPPLVVPLICQ